jgi:phosphodiesterase/alkaline phosphatase D-like protein
MILAADRNVLTMILAAVRKVLTMILAADNNVLTVILAADVHFAVNSNLVIEITAANSNSVQYPQCSTTLTDGQVVSIYRTDCQLPFHSRVKGYNHSSITGLR